jgi:hypothetical protein
MGERPTLVALGLALALVNEPAQFGAQVLEAGLRGGQLGDEGHRLLSLERRGDGLRREHRQRPAQPLELVASTRWRYRLGLTDHSSNVVPSAVRSFTVTLRVSGASVNPAKRGPSRRSASGTVLTTNGR